MQEIKPFPCRFCGSQPIDIVIANMFSAFGCRNCEHFVSDYPDKFDKWQNRNEQNNPFICEHHE